MNETTSSFRYVAKPIYGKGALIDVTYAGTDEEAEYKLIRMILADTGHPLIARHQNYAFCRKDGGTEIPLGTIQDIYQSFRYGKQKK